MTSRSARRLSTLLGAVLVLAGGALGGCSSGPALTSSVPDSPISVDGSIDDWQGDLNALKDGALSVGVRNDASVLYVVARTSDRRLLRRFVTRGLVLWLDPEGGNDEVLGVEYPTGAQPTGDAQRPTTDALRTLLESSLTEMRVRPAGAEDWRVHAADGSRGIETAATLDDFGALTVEFRVPLGSDAGTGGAPSGRTYALGAGPDGTVGVGIATPEREDEGLPAAVTNQGTAATRSRRRRRRRQRRARQRQLQAATQTVDVWTTVRLAAPAP
jgi:hypothetical protein